jgi:hypothetical protein
MIWHHPSAPVAAAMADVGITINMFEKTSYRRGVVEGIILYTLGRLGLLLSPTSLPEWVGLLAPLLFLTLQYFVAPFWATRRILSTRRERLSKRFLVLGPLLAAYCWGIDALITLGLGMPVTNFFESQQGPVFQRLLSSGENALSLLDWGFYELRTMVFLVAFFTLTVICTRLARGGFLRFTMPAGKNRVTL